MGNPPGVGLLRIAQRAKSAPAGLRHLRPPEAAEDARFLAPGAGASTLDAAETQQFLRIIANPMATAAAIDRVVHHAVILEFDVPSYRTDAAQQRGQSEEVDRQN